MASYIEILLHFGMLLSLSTTEPMPPQFPYPPPPTPDGMTPYDISRFPYPPPFGFPPPPPPSVISQYSPQKLPPSPVTSSSSVIAQATDKTPPSSAPPPPLNTDDAVGFNSTKYAYDKAARLALEVYRLVHPPEEEFLGTHMYFMLESPTARAVTEYMGKVTYARNNSGEVCLTNGEESALKDFRRRQAEVVWNCDAGWKINATLVLRAKTLLNTIDALDLKAYEKLKDCKPGQICYDQFKQSALAASIDKELTQIRRNQLIDLRVLSDQSHVTSLYSLYKCNADMSDSLRKDVYTSIARMNVCLSTAGLVTTM